MSEARRSRETDERIAQIERALVVDSSHNGGPRSIAVRMDELHVPAASVAVVWDGEIEWAKAYGTTVAGGSIRATTETLFEIGSVTKMVTAATVLRLVDRGEIDLDRDANDYLYSWKLPENEHTVSEKVTLRRLLTHTSGLPSSMFDVEEGGRPTTAQVLLGESPAINEPASVGSVPGSQHAYSNVAYVVIQQLVEDMTGQPFPDVVRETILDPLGMTLSGFDPVGDGVDPSGLASPHDEEGTTHPIRYHPTAVAQGGLWTTPIELSRLLIEWMAILHHQETGILTPSMAREMLRPQPALDISQYGWTDGQGLGVFTLGTGAELRFMHPGLNLPGATGLAFAWPSRQFGLVIVTNGFNGQMLQMEWVRSLGVAYGLELGL